MKINKRKRNYLTRKTFWNGRFFYNKWQVNKKKKIEMGIRFDSQVLSIIFNNWGEK